MIALFGRPGSGKSEQGKRIAEKYGWRWLSGGQLLRDKRDPNVDAGLKTGHLFDDNYMVDLMHKAIMKAEAEGVESILDGHPRTKYQAELMIENGDMAMVEGVIVLDVPMDEIWKRLAARGRADDSEEVINKRQKIFEQNTCSITPLLSDNNVKITTVDGVGTIGEVTERIEEILREWGVLDAAKVVGSEAREGRENSYGE